MHARPRPLALLAIALFAASCVSPTLPLPPPTVDGEAEGASGLWELTGQCALGATVYAWNDSAQARGETTQGAFVNCSTAQTFAVGLSGKLCDVVRLWQASEDGGDPDGSANTSLLLEPLVADNPTDPSACQ